MSILQRQRILGITASQWLKLEEFLAEPRIFRCPDLMEYAKVTRTQAIAVALVLYELPSSAVLRWDIHHSCSSSPVASRLFSDGFMPLPWKCPACAMVLERADVDLMYELVIETLHGIVVE